MTMDLALDSSTYSPTTNHPSAHHRFSPSSDYSDMSDTTTTSSTSTTHEMPPEDPVQTVDARLMAFDYIRHQLDTRTEFEWESCITLPQPNRARLAMRELGVEFEKRYETELAAMIVRLELTNSTVYPTFVELSKELFCDGTNWGRIIALFAFGGALAKHCVKHDMAELINNITLWVANFVSHQLRQWIDDNGGWEGFVTFYESRPSNTDIWSDWRLAAVTVGASVVAGAVLSRKIL